jgi:hypothetical protein
MNGAQVTMVAIYALNIYIGLTEHGKPKTGKTSFATNLISVILSFLILRWGGFWN